MLKTLIILNILLFSGCTSLKKDIFIISDLLIKVSINHSKKEFEPCVGVFPYHKDRNAVINLYKKNKDNLIYVNSNKVIFLDNRNEIIIYSISSQSDLEHATDECSKIESIYKNKNYSRI